MAVRSSDFDQVDVVARRLGADKKGGSLKNRPRVCIIEKGCGDGWLALASFKSGGRRRLRKMENGTDARRFP
jgi:hypothetical protein